MLKESEKIFISTILDELLRSGDVMLALHCGYGWGEINGAEVVRILEGNTIGVIVDGLGITREDYLAWQAQMTNERVQCRYDISPGKRCRKNAEVQFDLSTFSHEKIGLCRIYGGR